MSAKHKPQEAAPVEPDLPITPMLDMTFQLLSFFIFTYHPQANEGQIFITLPDDQGGGQSMPDPTDLDKKPIVIAVQVRLGVKEVDKQGRAILGIGRMTLHVRNPNAAIGDTKEGEVSIPSGDLESYSKEIKAKYEQYKSAKGGVKLQLEVDPKLPWMHTVHLIDRGRAAGYTDVAPTLLKEGEKKGG